MPGVRGEAATAERLLVLPRLRMERLWRLGAAEGGEDVMDFCHLHVHSNFSFYDGAAPLEDLVEAAARLEMPALAVTDHNSLAGAVRFYRAATAAGVRPLIGAEFTMEAAPAGEQAPSGAERSGGAARLLLLAKGEAGYRSLCRLVTCAHLGEAQSAGPFAEQYREVDRRRPRLRQEHLREHAEGLVGLSGPRGEIAALLRGGARSAAAWVAGYYAELLGADRFYLELQHLRVAASGGALRYRMRDFAREQGLAVAATNDVHYVSPDYAPLQDALCCLRLGLRLHEAHPARKPNAEYYLKSPAQMKELFRDMPEAVAASGEIAERCRWEPDLERLHLPRFDAASAPGFAGNPEAYADRAEYLQRLCEGGLARKYSGARREQARRQLEHELEVINQRRLADYFLIVWDLARFAAERGVRHSGRGSAAGSLVCYLLDLTQPDPPAHDLLFERFLNSERRDLPDIDLDFDTRRREEVVAYVYRKYGPRHVAAVATVNTFRAQAAVRELGKVLGLREGQIARLARSFGYVDLRRLPEMMETLPELRGCAEELRHERLLLRLCEQVARFPRHLAVHVGGLVISEQPLTDLVPLQLANKGIVVAQYDKDDIEALGLLKMDLLGLRIHTAIEHSLKLLRRRAGERAPDLEKLPLDDPAVYRLLRSTHTVGLFQLESPGQRNLQGRMQAERFEDIIAGISLFRPGPVQADMITPFLARRSGREKVNFAHPAQRAILESTWGVIIYQEQVMRVAAALGGFTLGEADRLRQAMNFSSSPEAMGELRERFLAGGTQQGIAREQAEEIFAQVKAFAAFGFNKAHAASFARIAYESAYLKAHHPAEFLAGLLSAQPMGFYPARTLAEEAKRLGIAVLPPCVNRSEADFTVEYAPGEGGRGRPALRCGLRCLREMPEVAVGMILQARETGGPFRSLREFWSRAHVPYPVLENLILARAFASAGQSLPQLLGLAAALYRRQTGGGLVLEETGAAGDSTDRVAMREEESPWRRLFLDLHLLGLSTELSPFAPWTELSRRQGAAPCARLLEYRNGATVRVAGIVVARARPPTRSGRLAIFLCLEDDTGLVDVSVFEQAYQRYGHLLYSASVLLVEGELTRKGERDLAVTARRIRALPSPSEITQAEELLPEPVSRDLASCYSRTGPGSYGV